MKVAPCKDCEARHMGCHSTCEGYQEFVKSREKLREEKIKKSEEYFYRKENIRKSKKKGGKR